MKSKYYLTDIDNPDAVGITLEKVLYDTGLSELELEEIVGRFKTTHYKESFRGKLKGEVYIYPDRVEIKHHFTKKTLFKASY